jgi:hypothetical protein
MISAGKIMTTYQPEGNASQPQHPMLCEYKHPVSDVKKSKSKE